MNSEVDMDLLQDFLTEAGDLLDGVDRKLIDLESHPDDKALLNEIFRGFHTIKGGAGFLAATPLVEVAHRTESLFDQMRSGKRAMVPELFDIILAATSAVRQMFDDMRAQGSPEPADPALLAALTAWVAGENVAPAPAVAAAAPAAVTATAAPAAPGLGADGIDWAALHAAVTGVDPVPTATTTATAEPGSGTAAPATTDSAAAAPAPAKAPAAAARSGKSGDAKETTLRIDVERFDQILNLSGEVGLIKNRIARLRTDLVASAPGNETVKQLDRMVGQLSAVVGDLQNSVMKARMQPVGRVFQKYVRMARDLGRQMGKDVELQLSGEDTEIDKTMIEEINDPLVHLVRNAVDHGVDLPQERIAAGKPPKAIIRLSAAQVGDQILIEIVDDGKGMRADFIRQKAVEKGLISSADAGALDEQSALGLIFLPGFSTKATISDVSGRGVGMDVVRTNVARLNGKIELSSVPGRGTRVAILLPLTLAILPVLMFRLKQQAYAIPLSLVREIIRIDRHVVQLVSGKPSLVMRGAVLPVLSLADMLDRDGDAGLVGIVIQIANQTVVIAVDSFVGQDEVVIKALDGFKPRGVAGATLASDGALVLVLDIVELLPQPLKAVA
jgi:two-component system chemotaxis sensor kinase CheA